MNKSLYTIPCNQGLVVITSGGYETKKTAIKIIPGPKSIYLEIETEQGLIELSLDANQAGLLIFLTHRAIQDHHTQAKKIKAQLSVLRAAE